MNNDRIIKAFEAYTPLTPLTEDEFRIFFTIAMSEDDNLKIDINKLDKESEIYAHFSPLIKSTVAQIFLKRLEHLSTTKITLGALILLLGHMKTMGSAVMYAYYMHTKLKPNTLVDLTVYSHQLFPMGMFSDEQLNNIWDIQKVRHDDGLDECTCHGAHDNLIDYNETWRK